MRDYKILTLIITLLLISARPVYAQITNTSTATDSSNAIRQKVEQKLNEVKKNPKAYVGAVTDKTEDTIQIKNDFGEILLVSIDTSSVAFVKTINKIQNSKYDDLAIGDFIIAMGFKNGNGVLEGKRILIIPPNDPVARKVVMGRVVGNEKKIITMESPGIGQTSVSFPKKWKGPELTEIEVGENLIAVGSEVEDKFQARTISKLISPQ